MIARPVATALGCAGCRSAILRAVVSKPVPGFGLLAQHGIRRVPGSPARVFSSGRALRTGAGKNATSAVDLQDASEETLDAQPEDTPWFLEVEPPRHPPIQHAAALPQVPDSAPALLEPMIKYIYEDMGLDDLSMLDLRDLDPPAALGPNLIMLFGTARSERHLHISAGRCIRWLRRNYKVGAKAGGLIGPGELKTKLRRLRKKAKLMGTNTAMVPGGDNGISTGWVCVNFTTNDGGVDESASFDESGRFSGFGAPLTGTTTVVVQCMTESRRNELDLETLWQGILKRSLEEGQKIRGKKAIDAAELEASMSSRVQLSTSSSAMQWQALKRASQHQRQFSTLARRLQSHAQRSESKATPSHPEPEVAEDQTNGNALDLGILRQQIRDLQVAGASLNPESIQALISAVFQASPSTQGTASERIALVDQLCLVAEERGMSIMSKDWLVTLIESLVASPAYGPELQRAQKNLEFLLVETRSPLDHNQVLRLMAVYAYRVDWERFWDVFRTPPRFQRARSPEQYELAYRVLAATGDRKLCTDALRWVYPEMLKEQPPIWPTGALYASLKACILVADPAAEELIHNPPPQDTLDLLGKRRLMHREFVRVLKEVENLRSHHVGTQAREQRAQALNRFSEQAIP